VDFGTKIGPTSDLAGLRRWRSFELESALCLAADAPQPPRVGDAVEHLERGDLVLVLADAGGDHVHGDGDARVVAVPERRDQIIGLDPGGLVGDLLDLLAVVADLLGDDPRRAGAIGDLLAEVVALPELLPDNSDDIVRVGVVLGVDERLGHFLPAGEDLAEELLLEGPNDRADLVHGNDVAVERLARVAQVLVELLPADGARLAVALVDVETGFDFGIRVPVPSGQGELADRDPGPSGEDDVLGVLNEPACLLQGGVDLLPGDGFRSSDHGRCGAPLTRRGRAPARSPRRAI
jgi:hypothetical protein